MQPNILVIMTDQQALSTIGAYGSRYCHTPNLDRLAEQSVVFDEAYTVCPICTPARASIQTGVYPYKHGMLTNIYTRGCMVHELPDSESLLPRMLQRQGYQTGYTGKWHLGAGLDPNILGGSEYPEFTQGVRNSGLPCDVGYMGDSFKGHGGIGEGYSAFKEYLKEKDIEYKLDVLISDYPKTAEIISPVEGTVPYFLTERAKTHLTAMKKEGKPFFYMLNHWQPHEPYHVPTKYLDMYRNMEIPPYESFYEDVSNKPFIHNVQRTQTSPDWEKTQKILRYYYAAVTQIDDEIGRLLDWLKEQDLYDDTVIMFTADHGETLGVHNQLADKGLNMYEETVHIPLMVKPARNMGIQPGRENALVNTCDIYSTILEMAGVDRMIAQKDGLSLIPLLDHSVMQWRECTVTESSGIDNIAYSQRMLRIGQWKFVFHASDRDELYDLENDPFELRNLAVEKEYQLKCVEMRAKLRKWMVDNGDRFIIRYDHLCEAKNKAAYQ